MTGGTLDIPIKKREYRVEIRRIGIVTSNTPGGSSKFILMTPVDTDGVVIRALPDIKLEPVLPPKLSNAIVPSWQERQSLDGPRGSSGVVTINGLL